jgi:hypothetical protein
VRRPRWKHLSLFGAGVRTGFPVVIGKFLALRNYALRYKEL